MPDLPSRGSQGAVSELKALVGSVLRHSAARISLVGWEGREAVIHYIRLVVALITSLILLMVGYLFLLLFFVFFLARWLGAEWMWVALALAAVHGAIALAGIVFFVSSIRKPVFVSTLSEIKKDIETLRPQPK